MWGVGGEVEGWGGGWEVWLILGVGLGLVEGGGVWFDA